MQSNLFLNNTGEPFIFHSWIAFSSHCLPPLFKPVSAILILLPICVFQEVSAFGEEGEGDYLDDWTVLCNGPYWVRDGEVRFKHSSTEVLLSVTGEQYGRPISGQKEVHGMAQPSQNNYWKAMEGIFMKPSELLKAEGHHTEL